MKWNLFPPSLEVVNHDLPWPWFQFTVRELLLLHYLKKNHGWKNRDFYIDKRSFEVVSCLTKLNLVLVEISTPCLASNKKKMKKYFALILFFVCKAQAKPFFSLGKNIFFILILQISSLNLLSTWSFLQSWLGFKH